MVNNNDRFNIYEVNSLLFQIISLMSEAERRKLQAGLIAKFPYARNGKDLSSIITSISEAKRCKLLLNLLNWYNAKKTTEKEHPKHLELRGYPRKTFKIPVELSKNGFTFMCLTQNISNSGMFIQTDFSFHVDEKVSMILSPPQIENDVTVGGKIVRVDSRGIGVKCDELLNIPYTSYLQPI
jgi:hypothetical protein